MAPSSHPELAPVFQLRITAGPESEQVFALGRAKLIVGRNPANEIHLTELYMARAHFALDWDVSRAQFTLVDYGSVNGVLVNGEFISADRTLVPGDIIQVGSTTMVFESIEPRSER
jgi:pSer/pThr/pTyr-binding forkhead associated (FHA) protein